MTGIRAQWSLGSAGPLLAREEREEGGWRARAACAGHDADLFFSGVPADVELAKSVCAGCPVRDRCADFALKTGVRDGVWAGMGENELRAVPGRRGPLIPRRPAPAAPRRSSMPDLTDAEVAVFRSRCAPGGCGTVWAGPARGDSYGVFRIRRGSKRQVLITAHRLAYKLATGTDPGTDNVRQQCGNPACLTPACLVTESAGEGSRRAYQQRNAA